MFPVSDVIPPRTTPFATLGLLAVTTLSFLHELQLDRVQLLALTRTLGVMPAAFEWPQLITSLFLHDGWIHLGSNVLFLWLFGGNVEDSTGHLAFVCFYLAAGALGAIAYVGLHAASLTPLIGASSAVAGVMGAYFVLFPRSQVLFAVLTLRFDVVEVPAVFFPAAWFLLQLAGRFQGMGVQAADAIAAFGSQIAAIGLGIAVGSILRWQGRTWDAH